VSCYGLHAPTAHPSTRVPSNPCKGPGASQSLCYLHPYHQRGLRGDHRGLGEGCYTTPGANAEVVAACTTVSMTPGLPIDADGHLVEGAPSTLVVAFATANTSPAPTGLELALAYPVAQSAGPSPLTWMCPDDPSKVLLQTSCGAHNLLEHSRATPSRLGA
jgi:hypothetical protein